MKMRLNGDSEQIYDVHDNIIKCIEDAVNRSVTVYNPSDSSGFFSNDLRNLLNNYWTMNINEKLQHLVISDHFHVTQYNIYTEEEIQIIECPQLLWSLDNMIIPGSGEGGPTRHTYKDKYIAVACGLSQGVVLSY